MCSLESDLVGEGRTHFHRLGKLPGPRDQWRVGEDFAAARGMSLSEAGCKTLGIRTEMAAQRFNGVELPLTEPPPVVILQDYPSVAEDRQRAAIELDRLADLGKIHWYKVSKSHSICLPQTTHKTKGERRQKKQRWRNNKKRTESNVRKTSIFRLGRRVNFLQLRTRACMH